MRPTRLIVGLGNPGLFYRGTRHNLGFVVVEALARRHRSALRQRAYQGRFGQLRVAGHDLGLLLPQTFMNMSGDSLRLAVAGLGLTAEEVLVVLDDLDLPPGSLRLRAAGSSGGHNGLESILEALGTEQVPRLRVGIGRPPDQMVVEWVLGYPSLADRQALEAVVPQAVAVLDTLIAKGFDAAQRLAAAGGSGVEAVPDR